MGVKIFGTVGIDQRNNHLVKDPLSLRDARNIRYTKNNEYGKRNGQETHEPTTNWKSENSKDFNFFQGDDSVFYFDGINYKDVKKGIIYDFHKGTLDPQAQKLSTAESLNTLLFTHTDSPTDVMKYDGKAVYRAGLPVPEGELDISSLPTNHYTLGYFSFIDAKGNIIDGPSVIIPPDKKLDVNSSCLDGFKLSEIILKNDISGININLNESNRTIEFERISADIAFNIAVGDLIPLRDWGDSRCNMKLNQGGDSFTFLEIESFNLTSKTITFTEKSLKDKSIDLYSIYPNEEYNLHSGLILKKWASEEEFTGYSRNIFFVADFGLNSNYVSSLPFVIGDGPGTVYQLDDIQLLAVEYDITTSKLRPPPCRILYVYGYQLVCGNILGFYDFKNNLSTYPNDDLIMYSDMSAGDTPESFSEINRQLIGETQDGEIKGLGRVRDSLIVFKSRGVHAIDGVLMPGAYSKRTLRSLGIGCTDFKSIIEIDNALFFSGQNGIYHTDGSSINEISLPVFNSFKGFDMKNVRSCHNPNYNEALFFIDGLNPFVFVLNYENGGIFIWDEIDSSRGFICDNSFNIYCFGELLTSKMNDTFNDFTYPIDAWIKTSWDDMKQPGLLKKINGFRIYSFSNKGQIIEFSLWNDWTEDRLNVSSEIDEMEANSVKTKLQKTGTFTGQSFSLMLRNKKLNQDLSISGFEIDMAINQSKDKNVK